jgi:hypothetical protein
MRGGLGCRDGGEDGAGLRPAPTKRRTILSAEHKHAPLRREVEQKLVAGFWRRRGNGCWREYAGWQDRGVERDYGDDYVCHHHRLGVDQDAVSQPDDSAEGLHDAERFVIAEKIGCGDESGGEPAD